MALLSVSERSALRELISRKRPNVAYSKAQFDAALQAVEDRMTSLATRNALGGDIETAAPGVFSNAQKDDLFVLWCRLNVQRGGML